MTPAKYMTKKEKKLYRRYLSELHITNLYQLTKLLIDIFHAKKIPRTISLSTNTSKKPSTNFLHMLCSLKKGL